MTATKTGAARLASMNIRAKSPDRSVTVSIGFGRPMSIEFDPSLMRGHSERSLAAQVSLAVRGAGSGFTQGFGQALGMSDDPTPRPGTSKQRRLHAVVSQIDSHASSRDGLVRARLTGSGDVAFAVRPGTLHDVTVTPEQLAAAFVDAHRSAQKDYMNKVAVARRGLGDASPKGAHR